MADYVINLDSDAVTKSLLWKIRTDPEVYGSTVPENSTEQDIFEVIDQTVSEARERIMGLISSKPDIPRKLAANQTLTVEHLIALKPEYRNFSESPDYGSYLDFYYGIMASVSRRGREVVLHTTSGDRIYVWGLFEG